MQISKCMPMVEYASENSCFYKELYKDYNVKDCDCFFYLPIINKCTIQSNYKSIICPCYDNTIMPYKLSTSGTSGRPLKIYWHPKDFIKSNFYTWILRKKWYNIYPDNKYCTFHSVTFNNNQNKITPITIYNKNRVLSLGRYIYDEEILSKYIKAILEFKPRWILAQPSVLYILSDYIVKKRISLPFIDYIELNGEFVDIAVQKFIQQAFPQSKVSNLYGSVEFNGIAMTCPYGNMHIINQNVFVEAQVINNMSMVIITSLTNHFMPFIRYNIGDIAVIKTDFECPCGNTSPCIDLHRGRVHEIVKIDNEKFFDPAIFNNIIEFVNMQGDYIISFKLKIINNRNMVLYLLTKNSYFEKVKGYIPYLKANFPSFGNIQYSVEVLTDASQMFNDRGKYTFIQNEKNF